ncbi:NRAMP family divalent metal transporter [Lewinella sp. W8]|uniref:NRAMP family divalent metal transporter n=1 Tax=Lewinella sp. W8 TaxID=2528208 RepID=UPI001564754B|nr:divalent metal cation transporter [Lewinella sp. W8]
MGNSSSWGRALVWSLIAAAFIGPGTVTTATRAGTEGGFLYIPTVALAAIAGLLLMEMAARLTLVSGRPLGAVLGQGNRWLAWLCFLAVLLGCAAYQAGNLLGALGGVQLLAEVPRWCVLLFGLLIATLMWGGKTATIARWLAAIVSVMGLIFMVVAVGLIAGEDSLAGQRQINPATVVALVGTTIVPYNFFLAAGLSHGQGLGEMRRGLFASFLVGAVITLSIILVGGVTDAFSGFEDLARTLDARMSGQGAVVLGFGLFAAGFSSAVTAPLAAAMAGRELIGREQSSDWENRGRYFRLSWGGVLLIGLLVALLDLDIIGVIVAAQIANGLLLPFVAGLVLVFANDRALLIDKVNSGWQNLAGLGVAVFLAYKNADFLLQKAGIETEWTAYALTILYLLIISGLLWARRQNR